MPDSIANIGNLNKKITTSQVLWLLIGAIVGISLWLSKSKEFGWLRKYPRDWQIDVTGWINAFMKWFLALKIQITSEITIGCKDIFRTISDVLSYPMELTQAFLQWLPWPAAIALLAVLAYAARGRNLAIFTICATLYMVLIGYWSESMNTLSLVFLSVPLAVSIGLFLGIWAYNSPRVDRIVQPVLDLMQTVPTFAYLIPILLLFGFGPVVGLIASAIYAVPPMVRNVILGLQRIPHEVVESAIMSGTTKRQLLWWVKIPSALPTIMIGVNQTVMAALSMVIIAALIGSSADIGWEVLSTMRKAAFGESLLSGIVIALIAMIFDRISRGFTEQQKLLHVRSDSFWKRHRLLIIAICSALLLTLLAQLSPVMKEFPMEWSSQRWLADQLNGALNWVISNYHVTLDNIKNFALFFFLLPLRVGLETAIRPHAWGFKLTPVISAGYASAAVIITILAGRTWGWKVAVTSSLLAIILYFGVSKIPWPAFILVVSLISFQVGGWRILLLALLGLMFIASTGMWVFAMKSVYLCAAAVTTSFALGGSIGVWAAHNDKVSNFVRPINDTLQTMPLFVLLIPVLMFFQIGEFTAYLAIIMYAVVPAIRYTEHGLRHVPREIVEAGQAVGCTRSQLLWKVKLPLAIPEIMLGLNQTIMFGLAMLVIAALVGTKGLGQQIYLALNAGNTGKGLVAGFGIALIAIISDRIIQSWSSRKKAALGLE